MNEIAPGIGAGPRAIHSGVRGSNGPRVASFALVARGAPGSPATALRHSPATTRSPWSTRAARPDAPRAARSTRPSIASPAPRAGSTS